MNFAYKAYTKSGGSEAGVIEARDVSDAIRLLASKGKVAFDVAPSTASHRADKTSPGLERWLPSRILTDKVSFTRLFLDLAILTEAGMTISQALKATLAGETSPSQRTAIEAISTKMSTGSSAAEAFASLPDMPAAIGPMIAAGEHSANLTPVFRALAESGQQREQRAAEIKRALAYPAFLLAMMVLALGVIVFVLTPALMPVFENSEQPVPIMIGIFNWIYAAANAETALLFAPLVCVLACFALPSVRERVRPFLQRASTRLPIIGGVSRDTNLAQYLRSLGMLLGSGLPMTQSLALATSACANQAYVLRLRPVRDQVAAGARLPSAFETTRLFDPKTIAVVAVGDEVNRLPLVLTRAAHILEERANQTVSRAMAAIGPAFTLVLGLVIGMLVVSVMTALLGINDLVGIDR